MSSNESAARGEALPEVSSEFINAGALGPDALLARARERLAHRGWVVVEDIGAPDVARRFLSGIGSFLPQYDGNLAYEVTARPGFEAYQYSQSQNGIRPHTEAPGYEPPPSYLALHCRRQAGCGGGHTLLADGYRFIETLPSDLRALAETRPVRFQTTKLPGASVVPSIDRPLIERRVGVGPILRYSYNVMRYDHLHPRIEGADEEKEVEDPFFRAMCARGLAFFEASCDYVLVPTNGILVFDNVRMLHARHRYEDRARHLTRYWLGRAGA